MAGFALGTSLLRGGTSPTRFIVIGSAFAPASPFGGFPQNIFSHLLKIALCVAIANVAFLRGIFVENVAGAILSSAGTRLFDDSAMFRTVVIGLSSGTFLYVGVMELLAKELAACKAECRENEDEVTKFVLFLVGWGTMALLALWT